MTVKQVQRNDRIITIVQSDSPLIIDTQSALDLIAELCFGTDCNRVTVHKNVVSEDFFRLSSGIAGEILQKFVNYSIKLAIIGDFTHYTSKPLQDFIYECNKGNHIFFVETEEQAISMLATAE